MTRCYSPKKREWKFQFHSIRKWLSFLFSKCNRFNPTAKSRTVSNQNNPSIHGTGKEIFAQRLPLKNPAIDGYKSIPIIDLKPKPWGLHKEAQKQFRNDLIFIWLLFPFLFIILCFIAFMLSLPREKSGTDTSLQPQQPKQTHYLFHYNHLSQFGSAPLMPSKTILPRKEAK